MFKIDIYAVESEIEKIKESDSNISKNILNDYPDSIDFIKKTLIKDPFLRISHNELIQLLTEMKKTDI